MKKPTTTNQINDALPMLQIVKVEICDKSTVPHRLSVLDKDTFIENIQFLNESGILADCTGWTYEKSPGSDAEYVIETGRMDPDSDYIVTAYVRVKDNVNKCDLEKMLMKIEED